MERFLLQGRASEFFRAQMISGETLLLRRVRAALMSALSCGLGSVLRMAEGETRDLLTVLFSGADLDNLRFILRGLLRRSDRENPPLWRGYGILSPLFYDRLWSSCSSLQEVCELCQENPHPVAGMIASTLAGFLEGAEAAEAVKMTGGDVRQMERALLCSFLEYGCAVVRDVSSGNGRALRQYLLLRRDVWNMGVWFRHSGGGDGDLLRDVEALTAPEPETPADPGRTGRTSLKALNFSAAFLSLWNDLKRDLTRDGIVPSRGEWHYRLRFGVLEWLRSLYRTNPLGIETLMGYTGMELIEWHNLNVVASGLAFSMFPERIYCRLIPLGKMRRGNDV
jgi:V/A-type H+-transporting ATPase subunit C